MGPGMRHPLPGKERVADVCPDALGICRDVSYSRKKQPLTGWLLYMFLGIRYAILFTAVVKRETFLAALFL